MKKRLQKDPRSVEGVPDLQMQQKYDRQVGDDLCRDIGIRRVRRVEKLEGEDRGRDPRRRPRPDERLNGLEGLSAQGRHGCRARGVIFEGQHFASSGHRVIGSTLMAPGTF